MRGSSQSAVLLLVAFAALIFHSIPSFAETRSLEGIVVHIADGDTITVLDSNKVQHRVRIAGIDAPEKNQPFGNASRKRLVDLVARKEVRVEFNKHDRYGRILGKVLVKPPDCPTCGKTLDVGLAQITTGMAWWYRKYANEQSAEDQGRYEFAEQEARAKKAGLWKDKIRSHRGSSGKREGDIFLHNREKHTTPTSCCRPRPNHI
jgi:endonuclease YncB( thermonuclease family)